MGVNSLPWYYADELQGLNELTILPGEEWHHCSHVLRMAPGDALILFDGRGHGYEGIIRKATRAVGSIELIADRSADFQVRSNCHINIAFAPTKSPDRTETAIEKIVELGVDSITFLECINGERSRIRMDRVKKIAIGAAKQSRKLFLPLINDFITPNALSIQAKLQTPNSKIICCHMDPEALPLHHTYQGEQDVVVLVGPEGGFAPEEIEELKSLGALMTTLGPFRLRVETAVITACANIHLLNALKQHP
jgi:16S rRNA (uracil1498-N3)-methyltransferase